jgi:6-phosphogluconolactonase
VTVDHAGRFALVAYNDPSGGSVHRINADGTVGDEVAQAKTLDCGIFAHQIRVTPHNDAAIMVCRGNDAGKRQARGSRRAETVQLQGRSAH